MTLSPEERARAAVEDNDWFYELRREDRNALVSIMAELIRAAETEALERAENVAKQEIDVCIQALRDDSILTFVQHGWEGRLACAQDIATAIRQLKTGE